MSRSLFPVSHMCVTVTLEEVGSSSPQYHPHPLLLLWINSSSFTLFLFFLQHQLLWQQLQRQTDDLVAQRHAISRPLGHEQGSARLQVELKQPREGREFSMYLKYSEKETISDPNHEMCFLAACGVLLHVDHQSGGSPAGPKNIPLLPGPLKNTSPEFHICCLT